jgi:predicted DCC family thiol-disulfide oxidoreductase YuxK
MGSPGSIDLSGFPIILFDGVCNLCNQSVQFVIRHDAKGRFRFAALQSSFGQSQLEKYQFNKEELLSVVLVVNNRVYDRSRAALEIARRLDGPWPLFYIFVIVPPFIRNFVYNRIARNRYKWFGKKDECMIPTPELRTRFIG